MSRAKPGPTILHVTTPVQSGQLHVTTAGLATRFGMKKSWSNELLAKARKLRSEGRDAEADAICPPWVTIGKRIFFKVAEIEAWVARHEVPFGTVSYGGDHPSNRRAEKK